MIRTLLALSLVLATCLTLCAQGISYQAVVRGPEGTPLANQDVAFRFSFAPDSDTSLTTYAETYSVTTNEFGLATLALTTGEAEEGSVEDLNFATTQYWLRTELDVDGGTDYEMMGAEPLRAVPYTLNGGAPAGGDGASLSANCIEETGGLKVCAWTIGGRLTNLTGNPTEGFTLTTDSEYDPTKIIVEGVSASANGQGDFKLTIERSGNTPVNYYQFQIFDLANDQIADPFNRGHTMQQRLVDGDLDLTVPNIGANYPVGFRLILN